MIPRYYSLEARLVLLDLKVIVSNFLRKKLLPYLPGNWWTTMEHLGEKEKGTLMRKEVVVVSYGSHSSNQLPPAVV